MALVNNYFKKIIEAHMSLSLNTFKEGGDQLVGRCIAGSYLRRDKNNVRFILNLRCFPYASITHKYNFAEPRYMSFEEF